MGNRTKRKGRPRKYRTKRKCVTRKKVGGNFFLNWWNRKEIERQRMNMNEIVEKNEEIREFNSYKNRMNRSQKMRAMDGEKKRRLKGIASDRNLSSREKIKLANLLVRLELMTELATRDRDGRGNKKRRKKRKKKTKRKKKVVYT